MRGSLESFKQASNNAISKAQLMVGLNKDDDDNGNAATPDIELSNRGSDSGDGEGRTASFRNLFSGGGGGGVEEDPSLDNSERSSSVVASAADLLCPELTFQQRLIGFATCFTIAYLITFMSFKFFVQLIEGHPVPFAVNYTVGNILAMSASGFLCGPKRQFRNMFDERRKMVSIVYLSCLASTLIVVFIPLFYAAKLIILIALLITQCGANVWYSLSYVPYGRKTALRLARRHLGLNTTGGGGEGGGFMGLGGGGLSEGTIV
mmetsp:Transcript_3058/g.6769  ORF Transcript_3058/g.6769 Transcript_3058/m.6769 type:complete len:263 (+) Transcript_3058:22-810(+)